MANISANNDLQIYRYRQGIMLLEPEQSQPAHRGLINTGHTLGAMSQLSFNAYMKNCQHEIQYLNDPFLQCMNYSSENDILGKTVFSDIDPLFAETIRSNNNRIMQYQRQSILDEEGVRLIDGLSIHSLSIKMPWYNENGQVMGLFGFGIIATRDSYAQAINQLLAMNLFPLYSQVRLKTPGKMYGSQYLTRRELDILTLSARGKTAKEIGIMLTLSKRTVEHYIENIKRKINVKTKSGMIEKAIDEFRII